MWFRSVILFVAVVTCASCERGQPANPPNSIWYSHAGCYGACPRFEFHIDRDGRGVFEGYGYTKVRGKRTFSVTPQQFDTFASLLEPAQRLAKPFDNGRNVFEQINTHFSCSPEASYHTDDSGVFVMWSGPNGNVFYDADFGCDSDLNKKLYDALDNAPNALGLKVMVGSPSP